MPFPDIQLLPTAALAVPAKTPWADSLQVVESVADVQDQRYERGGVIGPYEIIESIGEGGFSTVYKAVDTSSNTLVALKILQVKQFESPDRLQDRLLQHEQLVAKLRHPHLISVYSVRKYDGVPCIAMQYIEGGSLADRLDWDVDVWQPSVRKVLEVARQIADGLTYLHDQKLVHRDIKPSNLLLTFDDHVYLTDLGIPVVLEGGFRGLIVGTAAYIAPEAILYPDSVDGRADLYSLGIILFRLFMGHLPFQAESRNELLYQQINSPVPPLTGVSDKLASLITKCLEKDPNKRFQNVRKLKSDIERLLAYEPRKSLDEVIGSSGLEKSVRRPVREITEPFRPGPKVEVQKRQQSAYLIVEEGDTTYSGPIPIDSGRAIRIGRDPSLTTIQFHDRSVSRLHAQIREEQDGAFHIYDEGSSSGTFVNFQPISVEGMLLMHGDIIHLGRVKIRFMMTSPQDTDPGSSSTAADADKREKTPTEPMVYRGKS